jgi:CRISPR-associated protein Cas2
MTRDELKGLWYLSGITPYSGARFGRRTDNEETELPSLVKAIIEFIDTSQSMKIGNLYLLTYDITDNRTRKLISDYLVRMGMSRIQKSVFLGVLSPDGIKGLVHDLYQVNALYENNDSIAVIPLSRDKFEQSEMIGMDLHFKGFTKPPNCVVF